MQQFSVPTGPFHTFTALQYPLPIEQQTTLKSLARAIRGARERHFETISAHHRLKNRESEEQRFDETKEAVKAADLALSVATQEMREQIGVEVTRREFLLREQAEAQETAERKFRAGLA